MRLLKLNGNGDIALSSYLQTDAIPPYAILSHTWGRENEEVVFEDLSNGQWRNKDGYKKIRFCAQRAERDGLQYFWVDTCCINKADPNELSEAINSMYRWYEGARKCYVYLSDLSSRKRDWKGLPQQSPSLRSYRWFTRGWTLQELLAPTTVEFFSREGDFLGDKRSLCSTLEQATGIPREVLSGSVRPSDVKIHDRLRWADSRETTRPEDKSYCLLGLFSVFMPLIYGEGEEHAFGRLKEAIGRSFNNQLEDIRPPSARATHTGLIKSEPEFYVRKNRYKDVLASLHFDQMDDRRTDIKNAYMTTCRWLLQHPAYTKWTDPDPVIYTQHRGFMWIKGKPGAGKSTLVKFAYVQAKKLKSQNEILVSFFFNARSGELEKSVIGMYRSLLWQILDQAKDIRSIFDDLPGSFQPGSSDWSINMLQELFTAAVSRLGQRTLKCFIDALDECNETDVYDMINHLEGQTCSDRYFICFASRHYPTIIVRNGVHLVLENETGHSDDLTTYIQNHLRIDPGEFFDRILARTLEKANGVFMWAVLVVPILNKEYGSGRSYAVEKRLDEIPKGLSQLFQDILTRDTTNMATLLLCLQWILFAKNALSREEFYFAVLAGSDAGSPAEWDQRVVTRHAMDHFVLDSSKGLAELTKTRTSKSKRLGDDDDVTDSTTRVQFIHESVRDYLIKDGGLYELWPELQADPRGRSHRQLSRCCQRYLTTDLESHIPRPLPHASSKNGARLRETLHKRFPFLQYAVDQVLYHADRSEGVEDSDFLTRFDLEDWIRAANALERYQVRRHEDKVPLLYLLAEQNCPNLIKSHYKQDLRLPTNLGDRYRCPLSVALARRNGDAVEALLCSDSRILEVVEELKTQRRAPIAESETPYLWALSNGHVQFADMLIHFACTNTLITRGERRRVIFTAAKKGHQNAIRYLGLQDHADLNYVLQETCDLRCKMPGKARVVKALLNAGAEVNAQGSEYGNALYAASREGSQDMVALLLDAGAEVNAQGGHYGNALQAASYIGSQDVVALLLAAGADVNAQGGECGSALHSVCASSASFRGDGLWVLKMLLDAGADVNIQEGEYGTVLQALCEKPYLSRYHIEMVKLVLDAGVDVNARGGVYGRSPIQAAIMRKHREIQKLLRDRGART